ncbi:hypothetical protein PAPYR_7791 [Paratrimastix pyriformis]|uniref:Cyclin N-terminal domain-containing protein n=1 Tax=Paratrimastix pyriformis TaxID=342808 RepID=A0ABQ8UC54_9EUKA|nr:hypothetical protein PAPYR_7791 [Paratrimastix pyriformis]
MASLPAPIPIKPSAFPFVDQPDGKRALSPDPVLSSFPKPVVDDGPLSETVLSFTAYCITQVVAMNEARPSTPPALQPSVEPLGKSGVCIGDENSMNRAALALSLDASLIYPPILRGQELSVVKGMLLKLKKYAQLRLSELLTAVVYIDTLSRRHWNSGKGRFSLKRSNLSAILLLSVMLAHKVGTDRPLANTWWARLFSANVSALNRAEKSYLELLEYHVRVPEATYSRYQQALVNGSRQIAAGEAGQAAVPPQ